MAYGRFFRYLAHKALFRSLEYSLIRSTIRLLIPVAAAIATRLKPCPLVERGRGFICVNKLILYCKTVSMGKAAECGLRGWRVMSLDHSLLEYSIALVNRFDMIADI